MGMDVRDFMATAQDAMSVKRVFGEPFSKNGVTVIPAARVWGGAGGGVQDSRRSVPGGQGGGFGIRAKPAGVYVVRGEKVRWVPAVDANQIVLGVQAVLLTFLLVARRRRLRRGRPGGGPPGAQRRGHDLWSRPDEGFGPPQPRPIPLEEEPVEPAGAPRR